MEVILRKEVRKRREGRKGKDLTPREKGGRKGSFKGKGY